MRDTIDMAREAGAIPIHKQPKEFALVGNDNLKAFEALVRADERTECAEHYIGIMRNAIKEAVQSEREACAKVCENIYEYDEGVDTYYTQIYVDAIRARGEASKRGETK